MNQMKYCIGLQRILERISEDCKNLILFDDDSCASVCCDAYGAVEDMFTIFYQEQGYDDIANDGTVKYMKEDSDTVYSCSPVEIAVSDIAALEEYKNDYYTLERYQFFSSSDYYDDNEKKEILMNVAKAYDRIEKWFMDQLRSFVSLNDEQKQHLLANKVYITELVKSNINRDFTYDEIYNHTYNEEKRELDVLDDIRVSVNRTLENTEQTKEIANKTLDNSEQTIEKLDEISEENIQFAAQMDALTNCLKDLTEDIEQSKAQVNDKLKEITDPEITEELLKKYTDQCVERVTETVEQDFTVSLYNEEEEQLQRSCLGDPAWNKLRPESKNFLTTAKVMFRQLESFGDEVDYSGVCLPVVKALENELKGRFYWDFLEYLRGKYGRNNYSNYPTSLLNNNGGQLPERKYTLGSVPYTLDPTRDPKLSPDKIANNTRQLIDYCKERLMSNIENEQDIVNILCEYSDEIYQINYNYRNPSAHIGHVTFATAKDCFDLVLDAERFLKKMLDSFDR